MVTTIALLLEALNTQGLRYCHWKSNLALDQALSGKTDIDLLVHRADAVSFRALLSQQGFRPAILDGSSFPSVEHYFALDETSGLLVHVHAYYRVITGESLAKNLRLPLEEMLLANTRMVSGMRLPTRSAELVVFTVRMLMKHTSLVELALLARDGSQVQRELEWLLEDDPVAEALELVKRWLPMLSPALFMAGIAALQSPKPILRRVMLGHQLRTQLHSYARHSNVLAWLIGLQKFGSMALRRIMGRRTGMLPMSGGAVIAFVGPEATGKSTLLAETRRWLSEHYTVEQIHAGKPRASLLSAVPNVLVPALRALLPAQRSGNVELQYTDNDQPATNKVYPLMFAIRSVLLAYDRRALLTRAYGHASNGVIVLCDRYPSLESGVPDSPQLLHLPINLDQHPFRRWLVALERQLYQDIPPPDLVIALSVPVEVAVQRNRARGKEEPEDYVRRRHARNSRRDFGTTQVYVIDTDRPLADTIAEVKQIIWAAL